MEVLKVTNLWLNNLLIITSWLNRMPRLPACQHAGVSACLRVSVDYVPTCQKRVNSF